MKSFTLVLVVLIVLVGCNNQVATNKLISPVGKDYFSSQAEYTSEGTAVEIFAAKGEDIIAPRDGRFFSVEASSDSTLGTGGYELLIINKEYTVQMYIFNGKVDSSLNNKDVLQGDKIGETGDALPISSSGASLMMEIMKIENNKETLGNIQDNIWWNNEQKP